MTSFEVGDRVYDADGFKAIVRYVGPVVAAPIKEEIWLGVEWDNPTRGKHDGSCVDENGSIHRYFRCAAKAGSFIRPIKVTSGISLLKALQERYVALDSEVIAQDGYTLPESFVSTSKGNMKPIEFVGEKKIRQRQQLSTLTKASARNAYVSTIGDVRDIAGHLEELDLQDNLLSHWQEVVNLGEQLPNLKSLLLHGNKMRPLGEEALAAFACRANLFQNLTLLALNSCAISSWAAVQSLEPHLPSLQALYLAFNSLGDLPTEDTLEAVNPVKGFVNLCVLDLTGCGLTSWTQVTHFQHLPALQELILDNNELPSIEICDEGGFQRLIRISIASNRLQAWSDIDNLSSYANLEVLRMSSIPLFASKGASEVRPYVLARVPSLSVFNGSIVSGKERETAEKLYLRSIFRELQVKQVPLEGHEAVLLLVHPRFKELEAKYAADLQSLAATASAQSQALSAEMVTVTFKNLSFGSNGSLEPVQKKLPKSLAVSKLQLLVKQLFGLDPKLQKLSMRVFKDSPPMVLEDEEATLQYYGVIDGADIFINE